MAEAPFFMERGNNVFGKFNVSEYRLLLGVFALAVPLRRTVQTEQQVLGSVFIWLKHFMLMCLIVGRFGFCNLKNQQNK